MSLWLEHRGEDGALLDRAECRDGRFTMTALVEHLAGAIVSSPSFTLEEARQLARPSAHLPRGKRPWVLRILGERDEP